MLPVRHSTRWPTCLVSGIPGERRSNGWRERDDLAGIASPPDAHGARAGRAQPLRLLVQWTQDRRSSRGAAAEMADAAGDGLAELGPTWPAGSRTPRSTCSIAKTAHAVEAIG